MQHTVISSLTDLRMCRLFNVRPAGMTVTIFATTAENAGTVAIAVQILIQLSRMAVSPTPRLLGYYAEGEIPSKHSSEKNERNQDEL